MQNYKMNLKSSPPSPLHRHYYQDQDYHANEEEELIVRGRCCWQNMHLSFLSSFSKQP